MYDGHWVPYTGSEQDVMGSTFPLQYMGYASVLASNKHAAASTEGRFGVSHKSQVNPRIHGG